MNQELIERIVAEAIRQLEQSGCVVLPNRTEEELVPQPCEDIVSPARPFPCWKIRWTPRALRG